MLTDEISLPGSNLPIQVSPPAEEPLTLGEAKSYLRVEHSDDDSLIGQCISAAREAAEAFMKISLVTQSWKISFNDRAPMRIALPLGPVQSISSVILTDESGASTTVASSSYFLDASRNYLVLQDVLEEHEITISYSAGFGGADNVPFSIKQGMLQHIAQMYENRGGAALPAAALALYRPWQTVRL